MVAPPVILFLLSVPPFQPSYQDRYMSFFAPIFYSVLALGVLAFHKRYLKVFAVTALVLMLGYGQVNTYIYGNNHGWAMPAYEAGCASARPGMSRRDPRASQSAYLTKVVGTASIGVRYNSLPSPSVTRIAQARERNSGRTI